MSQSALKLLGGEAVITQPAPEALFKWPDMTDEIEAAVLDVVRQNKMSGNDITIQFEKEFAAWQQRAYGVAFANGTLSLEAAMFAIGLKAGDEMICPTKTYWASCTAAMRMGIGVVFANVERDTMCLDPKDLPRLLGPRTKAIMVVHYCGHPADMDPIMAFAKEHGLKVIEDVSHAQGGRYKGRMLGTFGDAAAMSLMSIKSFSCGELGMMVTDDRETYERAIAYAHYERNNPQFVAETDALKPYYNIPLAGVKGRVNQVATAIGRIRLRNYDERIAEVRRAMNYFFDLMEGTPGFKAMRVDESTGSTMAGWYCPQALYAAEELGGLPIDRYIAAIAAETGYQGGSGANWPLHTHPYFQDCDLFGLGKPTRILYTERDIRELDKGLAQSENIPCISVPWFVRYIPEWIEKYAEGYKKVSAHYEELLDGSENTVGGSWYHAVN